MPYGRLEQFTELVVAPKIRAGTGSLSDSVLLSSEKQHLQRQQKPHPSSPSDSSKKNNTHISERHQWGGIADLKSLIHYMIKGTYNTDKEVPPVPDIPALLTDSIYRVCGAPPNSLCTINHIATGVVHLFPWRQGLNTGLSGGQSSVTYGLLSKVPSPKETRDRAKQAKEKKKITGVTKVTTVVDGEQTKEEEVLVVRVVCHDLENLAVKRKLPSKGEIHSGRVWVGMLSY